VSIASSAAKSKESKADIVKENNQRKVVGVKYFSQVMGNVHQNASRFSQVLTTISCNHPIKVMREFSKDGKDLTSLSDPNWTLVNVGPYEGYLMTDYLTEKKNVCAEEEYPKFFDGLELDITDLYYWARLYDQYVQGKSKVNQ
jgi:hypothetical protein